MKLYFKQEQASSITPNVKNFIDNNIQDIEVKQKIYDLYEYNSYFDIISNFAIPDKIEAKTEYDIKDKIICVVQNIIQRGYDAYATQYISNTQYCNLDEKTLSAEKIYSSLLFYDKDYKFDIQKRYYYKTAKNEIECAEMNNVERTFLSNLPTKWSQHMEIQKTLDRIIDYPNTDATKYKAYTNYCLGLKRADLKNKFANQRTDFAVILPQSNCMAIELDGPQHQEEEQASLDTTRDFFLKELFWHDTLRITDINNEDVYIPIIDDIFSKYFSLELSNVSESIKLAITAPIFASRAAKTIAMLAEKGLLRLFSKNCLFIKVDSKDYWSIILGIQDMYDMIYHIINLKNQREKIPVAMIKLDVAGTNDTYFFNIGKKFEYKHITKQNANTGIKYDLIIKGRMEHRLFSFSPKAEDITSDSKIIWLYSSYGKDSNYEVKTTPTPIDYNIKIIKKEVEIDINGSKAKRKIVKEVAKDEQRVSLDYFCNNLFRIPKLKDEQSLVIAEALNRKNVLALLPTGFGKSITYQLSAILQPSFTVIIQPLISLMTDQVYNLNKKGWRNAVTINSTLSGSEKYIELQEINKNRYQFMFIAPERFQMKDQRDAFKKLNIANIIFDEAHCVSQWGHDFRTSYLLIGDSIQKHFKDVKIMALTGTASCNVLTDIKRDLCLTKNVKIITINSFRRKELIFGVFPYDNIELEERAKEESPINKYLYEKIIKERGKYYKKDGKYNYGVIVFCPRAVASKKRSVSTVDFCRSFESYCKTHNIDDVDAGIYHGQLDADDKKEVQDKFVNNEINILFATKAFGMGIDKPNISATIHSCLPESVEAFYQEAGRAGRNGNKAYCVIMASCDAENPCDYSETKDSKIYEFFLENSYPEKNKFKQSIIDVMNKKYIKAKTITTNIAKAIADNAILNTKKITFSNANNFKISIDKSTTGFVVYFDDDNNVKVEPKVPVDSSNITQQMFVEDIAEKAASQYSKYNATTFKRWFNKLTYTADNSLCEILDSGEKHECFIEEPSKIKGNENYDLYFLHNAIQSLILEYKKMQNAGDIKTNRKDFVISNEHLYKIQLINQDLEEHKEQTKYKSKNVNEEKEFKDRIKQRCNSILEEICVYNQMPSKKINIDEYYHSNYTEKIGITETEQKVIYYLGRLNIYSEYERGYYPNNYIKIQTNIVTKESLFEAVKNFVKSYETNDYANKTVTMDKIFKDIPKENDKISDYVIAAMNYIIDYSYEKIRTYRRMQSMIIYDSIREYLIRLNAGDKSAKLENGIYRYFEAKYTDELARDVNGNDNIKLTIDWIDKIELPYKNKEKILSHNANATPENNSNNFKEDLSHLRASAQKIFVSMDKAYTPYFLYAYGIFNDDTLDIDDGIEKFLEGCKRISDVRKNYKRELSRICTRYFSTTDLQYLQEVQKHLEKIKEDSNIKIMKEVLQKQINKVEEELSQEKYAKQKAESNKYEFGTEVLPDQEIPF